MWIGCVTVKEDVFRLEQCRGDFSKTDGPGIDHDNEEVPESRDALRGRRGHSDNKTRRGLPLHEEGRIDMQTIEMRDP